MSDVRAAQAIAALPMADLRNGLYESAIAGLRDGAGVERITGLRTVHLSNQQSYEASGPKARVRRLKADLAQLKRDSKRKRDLAGRAEDPDVEADFLDDVAALAKAMRALRKEIADAEAQPAGPPIKSFQTDGSYLAQAVSGFKLLPIQVDAATTDAIERVIADLTIVELSDAQMKFHWWLRVPSDSGVLRIGPLEFTVRQKRTYARRMPSAIDRFVEARGLAEDLIGRPWRSYTRAASTALQMLGVPAHQAGILVTCPIPEVIDIVSAHLGLGPTPNVTPQYQDLIVRTYITEPKPWTRYYAQNSTKRQLAIDLVGDLGGSCSLADLREAASPYVPATALRHIQEAARTRRQYGPWRDIPPALANTDPVRIRKSSVLSLVECQCGQSVDFAITVPEVVDMLLCRSCWRMPRVRDSPVFPPSYGLLHMRGTEQLARLEPNETKLDG